MLQNPHPRLQLSGRTTFPTELAVFCIKIHGCKPGMVMLDPFLGIGHAALAAKQCGVARFIGFDIDEEYVTLARRALQQANSKQIPLFEEQ